ncbi:MAG: hypothetical protein ACRELY_20500 [Polyangiaceae bacterium]
MRLRALLALATACSAAACFSFGDLSGGGDDSTSSDSGDDSTGDVDGQATGRDSSAGDAAPDSGSATAPFCLGDLDATFCADFDESMDAMAGFTSLYVSDGGVLGLDGEYTSTPRAFFSGNSTLASGTSAHAAIVRVTGATPAKTMTLDFDVRVDSLDPANKTIEALAIVNNSSTRSSLQMNLRSTSSEVGEEIVALDGGVTYAPHVFSKPLPIAAYAHVEIVVQRGSLILQPSTLTVLVSGEAMVDHVNMSNSFVFGTVDLYVGNAYSPGASSGSKIHYDNVSLTVE